MDISLINQFYSEGRDKFEHSDIRARWDEMLLLTEGSFSILLSDSQKPQIMNKNDIAFIPAGTQYFRYVISTVSIYTIPFFTQTNHPFRLAMPTGRLSLPEDRRNAIIKGMKYAFLLPKNHELMTHMIEHIMAENYMFGQKKGIISANPLSDEVLSTISYMNKNLDKRIDIDELASRVYLSHTGLIWKFKQELNVTPLQYLIELRLRYAKKLLLDHDYTVAEISEMCGYSNPYYFTNAFRHCYGMNPTAFKTNYLKNGIYKKTQ